MGRSASFISGINKPDAGEENYFPSKTGNGCRSTKKICENLFKM